MFSPEKTIEKWKPVLEADEAPALTDQYKKGIVAQVLENTENQLAEERGHSQYLSEAAPVNSTSGGSGAIDNWDPILISLVRRAMPNLIAYDIAGVQPMSGPTGLIFAMMARYNDAASRLNQTEALFNEALTDFSSSSFNGTTENNKNGAHAGNPSSLPGTGAAIDSDPLDDVADVNQCLR
jgi:hypothetical protein